MRQCKKQYKSLGTNAVLNAVRSGLSIAFPLITYPYAFRVLRAAGMGQVNYATSIISYFSLAAGLGISNYAVRQGARIRENRQEVSRFASEIQSFNLLTTFLSFLGLILCLTFIPRLWSYRTVILILGSTIWFKTIGMDWMVTVYEDYLFVTIESVVTHVLSMILLFLLVRTRHDVLRYASLTALTSLVICLMNRVYCRRYVRVSLTRRMNLKQHLRPVLNFFANSVATTIYVSSDTTMLGWMEGDYYVGIYSIAVKIYTVIKELLASLYQVAIPRISYYAGRNDETSIRRVYTKIVSALTVILLPVSAGLAATSREIIRIMGGAEYQSAALTLSILAVSLVGAIYGGAVTYCLNVPLERERYNARATGISAALNIGLNLFLIPVFRQNGAAVTTAVSEFFVFLYSAAMLKKESGGRYLDRKILTKSLFHAIAGVLTIGIVAFAVHRSSVPQIPGFFLIVMVSAVSYGAELIAFKDETAKYYLHKLKVKKAQNR